MLRTWVRLLPALALAFGTLAVAPAGAAAPGPAGLPLPTCATYGGVPICSGEVPSFDGTPLDVDLSLPTAAAPGGGRHPLIVLLHGFGNDKHEWESVTDEADGGDKWHWNSHWFSSHGYYVLAATARGFASQPAQGSQPATPAGSSRLTSPSATIHLKSVEFEVRDTQWLAALAAAALPDLDRQRVAVSGGSYGGGESWLQAAQPVWNFPHRVQPLLPVLQLQVAVPKYPWTDLSYSLAPNGHPGLRSRGNPIGAPKQSFAAALFALGSARGTFEVGTTTTPSQEGPINIPLWNARINGTGDPYETPTGQDIDPLVAQVRRGLETFRSAFYQTAGWQAQVGQREVAVFSISGWSDDLFPAVESFRQVELLEQLDPHWPVQVAVADVGHARAQNRPADWHTLNEAAWQFLSDQLNGSHAQAAGHVTSLPSACAPLAGTAVTAGSPAALAAGQLTATFTASQTLTSTGGLVDPNGPATDPIASGGCRTSPGPALGGYTGTSLPLDATATYLGLGWIDVPYTFSGQTGQLDARVWDVPPDGTAAPLLVTRGTYRLDVPGFDSPSGTLRLPLFGNHWTFGAGHRIRIDLTQVDQPFLRPSNPPSTLAFANPRLVLPTLEAGQQTISGQ